MYINVTYTEIKLSILTGLLFCSPCIAAAAAVDVY